MSKKLSTVHYGAFDVELAPYEINLLLLLLLLLLLQCTLVHYVHVNKLSLRAAVVANRSLTVTSQSICRAEWPIPILPVCR